jgi:hypothetical protein
MQGEGSAEDGEGAGNSSGGILFKSRDGGVIDAGGSQPVQSQLGAGRSLETSIGSRMGTAFGQDFSQVRVHTDDKAAKLSSNFNARAFTVGDHIAFGPGEYQPGTLVGEAIIAHELAHVVQQGSAKVAPLQNVPRESAALESDADMSAIGAVSSMWFGGRGILSDISQNALPRLKSGLRLQRCRSCSPETTQEARFSEVQRLWPTLTSQADKDALLARAIPGAKSRASQLFNSSNSDPVRGIRQRIATATGMTTDTELEPNPLLGVSQENVEQAYRAWAEGAGKEPWILLAIWKKEGLGNPRVEGPLARARADTQAISPDDAKAIYRSRSYYQQFGSDYYMQHVRQAGEDNAASFAPGTGAGHEAAFRAAIANQVRAGRLPRDLSNEINAEITATQTSPGHYSVSTTSRFNILSLMLAGAFFREGEAAIAADPRVGANPDPGLAYMRWNMGSIGGFLESAERHRMESRYRTDAGPPPTIAQWAFEHRPLENEYGQARRNAIRFRYFAEVFRLIYEGWQPSVREGGAGG